MSGKGSGRRPLNVGDDVFAANWERVFGKGSRPTVPADLPGSGVTGSAADSNSAGSGSAPDSPAIYIDNATGAEVS